MTAPIFKAGQIHCGLKSTYKLLRPCHARSTFVWEAVSNDIGHVRQRKVVIKNGDHSCLLREDDVLTKLKGAIGVRHLVDTIRSPPSLVLEYYEDDLRSLTLRRRLDESEIKFIAYRTLQALSAAHGNGIVHTDIKPQNILVTGMFDLNRVKSPLNFIANFSAAGRVNKPDIRSSQDTGSLKNYPSAALADWAEASSPGAFPISPFSFRGPEVWLEQEWTYSADIWSFGVVVASLLMQFGNEIFRWSEKRQGMQASDVLVDMHGLFGPMPSHMIPRAHQHRFDTTEHIQSHREMNWEDVAGRCGISLEAAQFVRDVLKLDPRERPSAKDLLNHTWFAGTPSFA